MVKSDDMLALEYGLQSDSCITVNYYWHGGGGKPGGPSKDNEVEHGCQTPILRNWWFSKNANIYSVKIPSSTTASAGLVGNPDSNIASNNARRNEWFELEITNFVNPPNTRRLTRHWVLGFRANNNMYINTLVGLIFRS